MISVIRKEKPYNKSFKFAHKKRGLGLGKKTLRPLIQTLERQV